MKNTNNTKTEKLNTTKNANKNTKTEKLNNIEKTNIKYENVTKLSTELIDAITNKVETKREIVKIMLNNGFYTSTTATDTINRNDLYIQLNVTDKPRIWLQKTGFRVQYDKNAKRDNKTEYYESIGKKYGFSYDDTPSFANRNRTSYSLPYDKLETILTDLYENKVLTTI